jgi:glycosyltransferase involved in cell wall biosynthesis
MNRVFINGRYLTQSTTGVQRCAAETVRALDHLIVEGEYPAGAWTFTLLVPPSAERPALEGITVRAVGRGQGQWWEQLQLPMHTRGGLLLSFANVAPLAARSQCVTIHDASVFAVPDAYRITFRTWYRFLLPALGRRADRVLTDSRFSREELIRWARIPERKLAVVPLAGEHILAAPADIQVLARNDLGKRPYIIAVSSGSPHKNLQGVARAVEMAGRDDYDLVLVGGRHSGVFKDGGDGSGTRIQRLGYVSDGELRALYENAACLLYPSLYEGFGLPPLEAMACGCPVIASNAASLPEVCGDAALYCDPRNPSDIAARIREVLDKPEVRQTLRERSLVRARQFRWSATARAVMAEVQEIVR